MLPRVIVSLTNTHPYKEKCLRGLDFAWVNGQKIPNYIRGTCDITAGV